jgi:hypothetical protein
LGAAFWGILGGVFERSPLLTSKVMVISGDVQVIFLWVLGNTSWCTFAVNSMAKSSQQNFRTPPCRWKMLGKKHVVK